MGQSADQLRQEIEQKREDAAQKIEQIESRVTDTVEQARTTVDDTVMKARDTVEGTVQKAKESVDLRRQVEEKPLLALGAALLGGFALGGMLGGGKGGQGSSAYGGRPSHVEGSSQAYYASQGSQGQGGLRGNIQQAAKSSGLEDMLANGTTALMNSLTERLKATLDETFPGFAEKLEQQTQGSGSRSGTSGSSSSSSGSSSGMSETGGGASQRVVASTGSGWPTGPAGAATTDSSGRTAPYYTSGETSGSETQR